MWWSKMFTRLMTFCSTTGKMQRRSFTLGHWLLNSINNYCSPTQACAPTQPKWAGSKNSLLAALSLARVAGTSQSLRSPVGSELGLCTRQTDAGHRRHSGAKPGLGGWAEGFGIFIIWPLPTLSNTQWITPSTFLGELWKNEESVVSKERKFYSFN